MTSPALHDDRLGDLPRAESLLDDGTILTHDWFVGRVPNGDSTVEVMIDGTEPETASALLPGLHRALDTLPSLLRIATDAVVRRFSEQVPSAHELDDAAADLDLEALEASPDGTVVLHLTDACGRHFPDVSWPAARLGPDGTVREATVES